LERYELEGDNFLKSIVTGDETWVAHHTPETKRQSEQWPHTSLPSTKKYKTTISVKKNHGNSVLGPQRQHID
jgi:hypothetical protein